MAQEEQVLVVERKVLEQVGMFQGLTLDVARYLRKLFAPGILSFIPRSQAEANPAYKQVIPYVIMSYDGKYLTYIRGRRGGPKKCFFGVFAKKDRIIMVLIRLPR